MRIQHNIAAMNAYRNYNTNTSAVSKNLEKLSSGYKINRAGDDAAGLAISEKMRAQISGLEAASKNVKDGISLVKTAEGAMQEVQDMLNRMVTLATQSANGTYDNEVDRLNLQKEVDQLRSEINRIADSSNFNGIKLMDGSQEIKTSYNMASPKAGDTTQLSADGAFEIVADGQLGVDAQPGVFSFDLSQLTVKTGGEATTAATSPIKSGPTSSTLTFTDGDDGTGGTNDAANAVYSFSLAGLDVDTSEATKLTFTVGEKTFDVSVDKGDTLEDIGTKLADAINTSNAGGKLTDTAAGAFTAAFDADTGAITVTSADEDAVASKAAVLGDETKGISVTVNPVDTEATATTITQTTAPAAATSTAAATTGEYKFSLEGLKLLADAQLTFTFDDVDITVDASKDDDAAAIAQKLADAMNENMAQLAGVNDNSLKVTAEAGTDGSITVKANGAGAWTTDKFATASGATGYSMTAKSVADAKAAAAEAAKDPIKTNLASTAAVTGQAQGSGDKGDYSISLAGLELSKDGTLTIAIGDIEYEIEAEATDTGVELAKKLADAINNSEEGVDALVKEDNATFTVAAEGATVTIKSDATGDTGLVDNLAGKAIKVTGVAADAEEAAGGVTPYQLSLGGNKFSIELDADTNYSGADLASKIADVLNGKTPSGKVLDEDGNEITDLGEYLLGGASFTATANSGVLTITMDEAPKNWDAASADNLSLEFHHFEGATNNGGEQFKATILTEPIDSSRERQYAQATLDLNKLNLKDGSSIQIGNTTYTFAIGADSRFKNASNVIDLTDKTQSEFTAKEDGKVAAGVQAAANRLSKVAASNATFYVGSDTNGVISLTEKEGAVDYTVNNLAGKEADGTEGLPDGMNGKEVTATVNDWKGLVKTGQASVSGSGLTLQIGDTSDEYNQLTVSIGDIHTKALGIDNIDISTQSGAQSAIDTIKNAINSVSSIRGTLGATQNRLEHTANNLSVMTENIQDAESTIRDTDIAEEMMAYTKNNILVQSAQAMLAQANQIPQGVLQLLG